jgi:hypothetical protein
MKILNTANVSKRMAKKLAAAGSLVLLSTHSQAADWSSVTGGIDFSGEITAIVAIIGVLAGIAVVTLGGRKVLKMLGN